MPACEQLEAPEGRSRPKAVSGNYLASVEDCCGGLRMRRLGLVHAVHLPNSAGNQLEQKVNVSK